MTTLNNTYRYLALVFILGAAAIIFSGNRAFAASLPGDGGYVKVGVGYSPYARTALDLSDLSIVSSGLAPTVVVGVVWARIHSLDLRWQSVFLADGDGQSQGFLAVTYTRYLQSRGPVPFFDIGFGLQHGPQLGSGALGGEFETTNGFSFVIGAGVRFSSRFEVAVDYATGATSRFFSANNNFDFSHQQLAFSARYTILGG